MKWFAVMGLSRSNEQRASQELVGNSRCEMEDTRQQQVQP